MRPTVRRIGKDSMREKEKGKKEREAEKETGMRDEKRRAIVAANVIALTVIKASERVN